MRGAAATQLRRVLADPTLAASPSRLWPQSGRLKPSICLRVVSVCRALMRKSPRRGMGGRSLAQDRARTRLLLRGREGRGARPGGVTLKWSAPKGAKPAHYVVLRDGKSIGKTTTERRSRTPRSMPGKTYRYAVRALRREQEGRGVLSRPACGSRSRHAPRRASRGRRRTPNAARSAPDANGVRRTRSPTADADRPHRRTRARPTARPERATADAESDTDRHAEPEPLAVADREPDARRRAPTPEPRRRVSRAPRRDRTAAPTAHRRSDRHGHGSPSPVANADGRPPGAATPTATATATPTRRRRADARAATRRRRRTRTAGPVVMTAAMVDRLFWRAGFGPTPAQRDAWTGKTAPSSSTGS